jgi:hypothetical protein
MQARRYHRLLNQLRNHWSRRRSKINSNNPVATPPNNFKPTISNAVQLGFLERGHPSRFVEACAALNVRQASEPNNGYGTRSYGARVIDESGTPCWLKVFGLTSNNNERWKAEVEADAIASFPKPELIRQFTWNHDDEFWVARLTTLVAGIVEEGPWAGTSAHRVEDSWLESLSKSLGALARQPCPRMHVQTGLFERWLNRHFRIRPMITPSNWVTSHNDLQWSNLSHPNLSILDWEWYGQSPQGFDHGSLIVYSCHDEELTARLEGVFEPALESGIGPFGKLFAAHTIRNSIRSGWLSPAMEAPVEQLIRRWKSHLP